MAICGRGASASRRSRTRASLRCGCAARVRERLDALAPRPQMAIARGLRDRALHLRGLARSLHAVSPLATVARGYAILQHEDGRVVRFVSDATLGERLHARLQDGRLPLRVEAPDPPDPLP